MDMDLRSAFERRRNNKKGKDKQIKEDKDKQIKEEKQVEKQKPTESPIIEESKSDIDKLTKELEEKQMMFEFPKLKLFNKFNLNEGINILQKIHNKKIIEFNDTLKYLKIHGPVSVYYYEWRNKNILLFGDVHTEYEPRKTHIITPDQEPEYDFNDILEYFANIAQHKNICIDFFLEGNISYSKYKNTFMDHDEEDENDFEIIPILDKSKLLLKNLRDNVYSNIKYIKNNYF